MRQISSDNACVVLVDVIVPRSPQKHLDGKFLKQGVEGRRCWVSLKRQKLNNRSIRNLISRKINSKQFYIVVYVRKMSESTRYRGQRDFFYMNNSFV